MTREQALIKLNRVVPEQDFRNSMLLNALEALGLIKFEESHNAFIEAKKYITDLIMYDKEKPEIKISEMAEIIRKLVRIIEKNNCNIDV